MISYLIIYVIPIMELAPIVNLVVTDFYARTYINAILQRVDSECSSDPDKHLLFEICSALTRPQRIIFLLDITSDINTLLNYLLKYMPVDTVFIDNCLDDNLVLFRLLVELQGQMLAIDGVYTDILLVVAKFIYQDDCRLPSFDGCFDSLDFSLKTLLNNGHLKDLSSIDEYGLSYKLSSNFMDPIRLHATQWSIYLYQNYPKLPIIVNTKQQIITFLTLRHCDESFVGNLPRELCFEIFFSLN